MEKPSNSSKSKIISITSGKGGVGKSIFTVNIAEVLTYMGYRVAVIDADAGLSNIKCYPITEKNFRKLISNKKEDEYIDQFKSIFIQ